MLKRIIVTGIVSSLFATALNTWMRRVAARKHEQEIDVQRWEDEGGHSGAVEPLERALGRRAPPPSALNKAT